MRLSEVDFGAAQPVEGYGPGFFRIGGQAHAGPLLIAPGIVADWGGYGDADALLALAGQVDVLFVGTGAEIAHIPADLRDALEGAGLGVEVMSSPAACRTYNVLLSEGRRIALALMPVD
ncbi:Mth938-like domain-containing protein [Rhodobacteraceae bacterium 2376]|uniref:Mth938-like domain-containing protein n=1 Tax=Rhabdonatronobacter sediminivivens TaxID=2743469 RepID=A0A7Z0HZE2_9RHOB|nr:Mth938-like domain-containing protein [Rhabdonatronobacter sediminivivens]NYS25096.1 Mth938-like domain-containing protein [Rhabdonatronobacter sediminivivens]